MNNKQIPPAQLWIGNHDLLTERVVDYLQHQLCATACNVCRSCMNIRQHQHPSVVWICPEKSYTLASIQEIHERIIFALAPEESVFFILQKADQLTMQCANSLLKSMEEPPAGYYFILCAQQRDALLPTVQSRCIISSYHQETNTETDLFLNRFFYTTTPDPQEFTYTLQKNPISEQQAMVLVDTLLSYWMREYNTAVRKRNKKTMALALTKITSIKKLYTTTPMPGSSGLFLKHLFMHYHVL